MVEGVHVGVDDTLVQPAGFYKSGGHGIIRPRAAHVGNFGFPVVLIGQVGEPARGKGIGSPAVDVPGDDAHEGRVGGVVHGGGRQGQTVAEALRDDDLGRKPRARKG